MKNTKKLLAVVLCVAMIAAFTPTTYAAVTTEPFGDYATISNVRTVSGDFPRDWHKTTDYEHFNPDSLKTFYCNAPATITFDGFADKVYYNAEWDENPEWGVTEWSGSGLPSMELNAAATYLLTYSVGAESFSFYFVIGKDSGSTTTEAPNLDSASSWAREGLAAAIGKGFVPADIQDNYTNVITRAEFCRMAVQWVEYATGKNIDAVLSGQGKSRDPNAFTDTSDPDILAAFALGITSGIGNNLFNPSGQFSREQAATMIMNTCRAIGANIDNPPPSGFADMGSASGWAVPGINFVRANGIMAGTGSDNFSPKALYTREQSIITFNNVNHVALLNPPAAGNEALKEAFLYGGFDQGDGGYQGIMLAFKGSADGLKISDITELKLFKQTWHPSGDGMLEEPIPFNMATDFYPNISRIYNEDSFYYENGIMVRTDMTYFVLQFKTPLGVPDGVNWHFFRVQGTVLGKPFGSSTGDAM